MREISIYKAEPQFAMGDAQNIDILKEKIQKDETLFSQIEQDYKQKPEEFKSAISGDSAAQKSEGQLVKVGQIIKPDGSVVTYYKNENGKIMKR